MQDKVSKLRSGLTLLVALAFMVSAPAFADHGGSSGGSNETDTSSSVTSGADTGDTSGGHKPAGSSDSQNTDDSQTKTEAETNAQTQTGEDTNHADLHKMGGALVSELEKNHHGTKSGTDRQKICTAHKQGLTKKFNAIVTNSQNIQNRIDGILTKAEAFQTTNNLNPANFDSLLATAKNAQITSDASIAALKDLTPSLDCNNVSVANDVATFKVAAQKTRDNLKAYRTAVKAVLQALEAAAPTGGSQ